MRKSDSKPKFDIEKALLASLPWRCTNFGNSSEIDAYVEQTGKWETIAETHSVGEIIDAEDIASFIVGNINRVQEIQVALKQALMTIKGCIACEGLDEKAKRKAENALKYIENALL
jgi:hypothetical protein